jgi:hypothetical protein
MLASIKINSAERILFGFTACPARLYAGCLLGSTGVIPLVTKILHFLHSKDCLAAWVPEFETKRANRSCWPQLGHLGGV